MSLYWRDATKIADNSSWKVIESKSGKNANLIDNILLSTRLINLKITRYINSNDSGNYLIMVV